MRIYLDNCCYNRPFDDQTQPRIRKETNAIVEIIARTKASNDIILGSSILKIEIRKISDKQKFDAVMDFYETTVSETIHATPKISIRALEIINQANIGNMDALHLSSAECGDTEFFLTTDDKLIKACKNLSLNMKVLNPVSYFNEVI